MFMAILQARFILFIYSSYKTISVSALSFFKQYKLLLAAPLLAVVFWKLLFFVCFFNPGGLLTQLQMGFLSPDGIEPVAFH